MNTIADIKTEPIDHGDNGCSSTIEYWHDNSEVKYDPTQIKFEINGIPTDHISPELSTITQKFTVIKNGKGVVKPVKKKQSALELSVKPQEFSVIKNGTSVTNAVNPTEKSEISILKFVDEHLKRKDSIIYRCLVCSKTLINKELYNAHVSEHLACICQKCDEFFPSHSTLINHTNMSHQLKCISCSKMFDSIALLNKHIKSHKKPMKCFKCCNKYVEKKMLKLHIRKKHTTELCVECEHCNEWFIYLNDLLNHWRKCDSDIIDDERAFYQCDICNKMLVSKHKLAFHMHNNHITKQFVCKFCLYVFSKRQTMISHMNMHHQKKTF